MLRKISVVAVLVCIVLFRVPAAGQPTVLSVGVQSNLIFTVDNIEQAVKDFMALHPGVIVEVRPLTADAIALQMAAGVSLDVVALSSFEALGLYSQGALRDLTDLLAQEPSYAPDLFLPGMLDAYSDGSAQWGLPFNVLAWVTTYNAEYFDMAGLPLPQVGPNWTWDTIREMGRKLTVVEPDGTTSRYGLMLGYNTAPSWPAWVPLTYQAGGGLVDRHMNPTQVNMLLPSVRQSLEFMFSLWDEGLQATHGGVTVRNGRAAMNMTFTPRTTEYWKSYLGEQARVGQIQQPKGPVQDGWFVDAQGFAIAAKTPNLDTAWEFVKFMTLRPESAYEMMVEGGRMSVLRENLTYFAENVDMASMEDVLFAIGNTNNVTRPVFPPGLMELVDAELAKVQRKEMGLDTALVEIQRLVDAFLADYHGR